MVKSILSLSVCYCSVTDQIPSEARWDIEADWPNQIMYQVGLLLHKQESARGYGRWPMNHGHGETAAAYITEEQRQCTCEVYPLL